MRRLCLEELLSHSRLVVVEEQVGGRFSTDFDIGLHDDFLKGGGL